MAITQKIRFAQATEPLSGPVTKFGGQPHWLTGPQWPLSRRTGKPMQFIGQIALERPTFDSSAMAYIFMTDDEDGTWEPEGGENAVVVQPGRCPYPTAELSSGPSLYRMVEKLGSDRLHAEPVEFAVELTQTDEPSFRPEEERSQWSDERFQQYAESLDGNKIGGTPIFLQGDEFPPDGNWKLLLQLDSTSVPFYVNFGDAGVAYAFISPDESEGRLLWQCC